MNRLENEDILNIDYDAFAEYIKSRSKSTLICFGASKFGELIIDLFNEDKINIDYFCDNNPDKWNDYINGIKIISPEELIRLNDANIVITSSYKDAIIEQLKKIGLKKIFFINNLEQKKTQKIPETLVPEVYIEILKKSVSEVSNLKGDIIEIGVYKGGSIYRMASHIQKFHSKEFKNRKLIGIDTFAGHPYSNPEIDPPTHSKGRFADTSYQIVSKYLSKFNFVDIIQGECGEIFNGFPINQKFCLAHIDVDIAQSAILCNEYIFPRLEIGGIMIYDEYQGYGQEKLINDFFKDKSVEMQSRTGLANNNYGLIVKKIAE